MNNWDDAPHRNLLLGENLEPVRRELENGGVVFGCHYYYAGGCGPTQFTFIDFDSFYSELFNSRPGDKFFVYSVDQLADRAILRLGALDSIEPLPFDGRLAAVRDALAERKEVIFVWRRSVPAVKRPEHTSGVLYDLDHEELAEALGDCLRQGGELLLFDVEMLDQVNEGKMVHVLAYGKRPNEAGLTPQFGPY